MLHAHLEHHESQHDQYRQQEQYEKHGKRKKHGQHEQQDYHLQFLENPRRLRDSERLVRRRGREPPTPTTESLESRGHDQHGGWQLHHSSTGLPFYLCVRWYHKHGDTCELWASPHSGPPFNVNGPELNRKPTATTSPNRATGESVWARGNTGASGGTHGGVASRRIDANVIPSRLTDRRSGSPGAPLVVGSSGDGSSSSTSSDTVSTSSASYSSHGGSQTSGDDARGEADVTSTSSPSSSSSSSSSESSDESSSSGGSWTSSMENKFRRMVTSEEGRKMLAMEVEALHLRQVARRARPQSSSAGGGTRRNGRRRRLPSYSRRELQPGEEDDVEMALLQANSRDTVSDKGTSSGSGTSSTSSDSSTSGSTGSSFTLHLGSESDGGSDLSLLTSDLVLDRLEKVEKVLIFARGAALSVFRASCGFGRYASFLLWTAARRGAMRARRLLFSGGFCSLNPSPPSPSSSFTPAAI